MIARRPDPESQLIEHRQRVVGAVGDEQDRSIQVLVQGCKDRQTRGARQSQPRQLLAIGLELFQQLLVLREFANLVEKNFHISCIGDPSGHPCNSIEPLYLFMAAFSPFFTNSSTASAARSTSSKRTFISSREKSCST